MNLFLKNVLYPTMGIMIGVPDTFYYVSLIGSRCHALHKPGAANRPPSPPPSLLPTSACFAPIKNVTRTII